MVKASICIVFFMWCWWCFLLRGANQIKVFEDGLLISNYLANNRELKMKKAQWQGHVAHLVACVQYSLKSLHHYSYIYHFFVYSLFLRCSSSSCSSAWVCACSNSTLASPGSPCRFARSNNRASLWFCSTVSSLRSRTSNVAVKKICWEEGSVFSRSITVDILCPDWHSFSSVT